MSKVDVIKVRSVPKSFRRGGRLFTQTETVFRKGALKSEELASLKAESNLVVVTDQVDESELEEAGDPNSQEGEPPASTKLAASKKPSTKAGE